MDAAIKETNRRRGIQDAYNKAHGIVPRTIVKDVRELLEITQSDSGAARADGVKMTKAEPPRISKKWKRASDHELRLRMPRCCDRTKMPSRAPYEPVAQIA